MRPLSAGSSRSRPGIAPLAAAGGQATAVPRAPRIALRRLKANGFMDFLSWQAFAEGQDYQFRLLVKWRDASAASTG